MMLENKTALIYGGGGAIGGTVARAFADAGARVYLAGRSIARLDKVASDIGDLRRRRAGRCPRRARRRRRTRIGVASEAGGIDIACNAVSFLFAHDTPFADLAVDEVMHPIDDFLRTNLITTKAVARHMAQSGSGTILTLTSAASLLMPVGSLGYGTTCAAIEELSKRLAVELGPSGIRVVCLRRAHDLRCTRRRLLQRGDRRSARRGGGMSMEELLALYGQDVSLLGQLPTLAQVADAAVFLASDHADAITGTVVDLTCGNAVRTKTGALLGVFA